jgi:uncharacterized protein YaaW (UPF0174 family)
MGTEFGDLDMCDIGLQYYNAERIYSQLQTYLHASTNNCSHEASNLKPESLCYSTKMECNKRYLTRTIRILLDEATINDSALLLLEPLRAGHLAAAAGKAAASILA